MTLPVELARLLDAGGVGEDGGAWAAFLVRYSPVLLKTARSLGGSQDAVMDRYAYVIEGLRRDDCRRLRAFRDDGRATFVTWLVVTARRLCFDHHRQRYGRAGALDDAGAVARRTSRRSLTDLVTADIETAEIPDRAPAPDERVTRESQRERLAGVLSTLPHADRLLLALRFEDDLSAREIAEVLEMATPFQVYRRLDRVLATLRASLRRDAFDAG